MPVFSHAGLTPGFDGLPVAAEPAPMPKPASSRLLLDRPGLPRWSRGRWTAPLAGAEGSLARCWRRDRPCRGSRPRSAGASWRACLPRGPGWLSRGSSAVSSATPELKRRSDDATKHRRAGRGTLPLVDETHRLNRARQDGFPPVENRAVNPGRRHGLNAAASGRQPPQASCNPARGRVALSRNRRGDDMILEGRPFAQAAVPSLQ